MIYRSPMKNIAALTIIACCIAGCSTTPTARFYTLNPMAQPAEKPTPGSQKLAVNVATVELPDSLNRQQIVTRESGNELKLAEFDRWGGALNENMGLVLAENLAQLLGSDQVVAYPRVQTVNPDYTLAVRVLQLDCTPGERVQLKAQWTLLAGAERKEVATRVTGYSEKPADRQYASLVAAVSRTLEQLSRDISREISAKPVAK
jgi:uncharacterized lipoprotein YmbA